MKVYEPIFRFLASLKLAVIVIVGLVVSLATGTILESKFDTPTAKYYVYHSLWFQLLLLTLGVNLFAVMLDRWPWRKRHVPFLLAHIGILLMLFGSWLTDRRGLDGSIRVTEGETSPYADLDQNLLVVSGYSQDPAHSNDVWTKPVKWLPPGVSFSPIRLDVPGLSVPMVIDQFLSHADADFRFVPEDHPQAAAGKHPAIRVQLTGGPMKIRQDFWLWNGQASWAMLQAGPAWLAIGEQKLLEAGMPPKGPKLLLSPNDDGSLTYLAISSDEKRVEGRLAADKIAGAKIEPGWKMVKLEFLEWVPDAKLETHYKPSHLQYGEQAAPSAVHLVAGEGAQKAESWLGLGDRVSLRIAGRSMELGYFRRRVMLPFGIRLDHFQIERYPGSMRPASYESQVTVVDPRLPEDQAKSITISMNEPLKYEGIKVYQASYEDAMPRPVVSIFSVNQDPGRPFKYVGSILIVLGSILLFVYKLSLRKRGITA